MQENLLHVGQSAPWFVARTTSNPRFQFNTVAGRHVVLCFFGSAADPLGRDVLGEIDRHRSVFDDVNICFFGVSTDPEDESSGRLAALLPGMRIFWDFDGGVSRLYGAAGEASSSYRRFTLVLDERLRVFAVLPFGERAGNHMLELMRVLSVLPPLAPTWTAVSHAPILIVPRVFEPELCRALIGYYEREGGYESGFMRDIDGKTVQVHDHLHKRRRDQDITDEQLMLACRTRLQYRLLPEVHKAFQFRATRIERYIVACYEAESGGHFRRHRDNTTQGTAHRRFAVSLVLNSGEFEGGQLLFPEFGPQSYSPPAGGAVVFSCSLLHEATPVTRGRRYAFLPFLYDEEAARVREENLHALDRGD
ncbi:peroxiredoxin [Zobellella endophytica]|uniref:Peroxiredoxin n=1 Tax=Zobellella endophytica TaxID=2116700 RepID=A0A2P7R8Z7_9GAMM|nr:2OG-Fe(II) oxygenase [Zobellella endophytica]PSJ46660.1 peroxiredoxin [Zobellella endophytica]